MLSRWTKFLTEDGEKAWRERDNQFLDTFSTKEELIAAWKSGWHCLFKSIKKIHQNDLEHIVYLRSQSHTVAEPINRQLVHYAYHIGQVVFLGKLIKGKEWQSLLIAKGDSKKYNQGTFKKDKKREYFTDEL